MRRVFLILAAAVFTLTGCVPGSSIAPLPSVAASAPSATPLVKPSASLPSVSRESVKTGLRFSGYIQSGPVTFQFKGVPRPGIKWTHPSAARPAVIVDASGPNAGQIARLERHGIACWLSQPVAPVSAIEAFNTILLERGQAIIDGLSTEIWSFTKEGVSYSCNKM